MKNKLPKKVFQVLGLRISNKFYDYYQFWGLTCYETSVPDVYLTNYNFVDEENQNLPERRLWLLFKKNDVGCEWMVISDELLRTCPEIIKNVAGKYLK